MLSVLVTPSSTVPKMDALAAYGSDSSSSEIGDASNHQQDETTLQKGAALLPPPKIEIKRWTDWKVDYLSSLQRQALSNRAVSPNLPQLTRIQQAVPAETGWATELQQQREFHNPNLFQASVEEFGIEKQCGSRVCSSDDIMWGEWENIKQLEEQQRAVQSG